jgi:hypothetical protein
MPFVRDIVHPSKPQPAAGQKDFTTSDLRAAVYECAPAPSAPQAYEPGPLLALKASDGQLGLVSTRWANVMVSTGDLAISPRPEWNHTVELCARSRAFDRIRFGSLDVILNQFGEGVKAELLAAHANQDMEVLRLSFAFHRAEDSSGRVRRVLPYFPPRLRPGGSNDIQHLISESATLLLATVFKGVWCRYISECRPALQLQVVERLGEKMKADQEVLSEAGVHVLASLTSS